MKFFVGLLVYNHTKLAMNYIRSSRFILDIFSLTPLDLLQIKFGSIPILRFPRFFKIYRTFQLYYLQESRTVYPNTYRVLNLLHILLLLGHWLASILFHGFQSRRFCWLLVVSKTRGKLFSISKNVSSLFVLVNIDFNNHRRSSTTGNELAVSRFSNQTFSIQQ